MPRRPAETHAADRRRPGRSFSTPLLTALVALGLLGAGCGGEEAATDANGPASPAAASPQGPDGSASQAGASDSGDEGDQPSQEEVSATVDELVDEVARARGLEPQSEIDVELVDRQAMGEVVGAIIERDMDQLVIGPDVLAALRFMPEGADLAQLGEQIGSAGIAGLYDHQQDQLYVVAGQGSLGPAEQSTAAHEIVHALQDQHHGLDRMTPADGNPDAAYAFRYLAEGDAVVTAQQWLTSELSAGQQQQALEGAGPSSAQQQALAELPPAIKVDLQLPYVVGTRFVQTVGQQQGSGGLAAVYRDPPDTAVEVIDPQLYLSGFERRDVGGLTSPGPAWNDSLSAPFSAHMVAMMQPPAQALRGQLPVASQWRGGQLRAWRADGELAVGVATAFAGKGASAFCDRVKSWYREQAEAQPAGENAFDSQRDAMAVQCGQGEVRFAIAPSVQNARAVIGG